VPESYTAALLRTDIALQLYPIRPINMEGSTTLSIHPVHARDPISAAQARRLLDSIRRLSFSNPTHTDAIFNALNELAWWGEADPDDDLAVEWIARIYPVRTLFLSYFQLYTHLIKELEKLSPSSPLYGKGLRRLRTLCGRTPNLPALFEVQETFVEDPPTPICQTGMSDVHRAKNERRVVALKTIRSNDEGIETYKRVRTTFSVR
jgi:hypothetical protein